MTEGFFMTYNPLPLLIFGTGLYFLIKLRFFFILHPIRTARLAFSTLKSKDSFRSLSLALAGTLGVGNIFGVSVGIIVGGAGSVFWRLASSLFSSVLKYAEVTLALDCIEAKGRGPGFSGAIKCHNTRYGSHISLVYSLFTLVLALVMGGAMQSGAAAALLSERFSIPSLSVSFLIITLLLLAITKGRESISRVSAVAVPSATVIYLLLSLSCLALNVERVPDAVSMVLCDAFSTEALGGGVIGFLFSRAMTEGFSRGMLSNEAGAGTSSTAHVSSGRSEPSRAGLLGMIEVFFDTALLCTVTALVILSSGVDPEVGSAMSLVYLAFENCLGEWVGYPLSLCVFIFAYSTVICWYYYGHEAASGVFRARGRTLFLPLFLIFSFFGPLIDESPLIFFTDLSMLFLSVICCMTLIKSSDRIKRLSERSGLIDVKIK